MKALQVVVSRQNPGSIPENCRASREGVISLPWATPQRQLARTPRRPLSGSQKASVEASLGLKLGTVPYADYHKHIDKL